MGNNCRVILLSPIENISQKEKVKLWGEVATHCLRSEISNENLFYSCLKDEATKRGN